MIGASRLLRLLGIVILLAAPALAGPEPERDAVEALLRPGPQGERAEPGDGVLAGLLARPELELWRRVEHLLAHERQDVARRLARQTDAEAIGPRGAPGRRCRRRTHGACAPAG
jgi:hypothetical protein